MVWGIIGEWFDDRSLVLLNIGFKTKAEAARRAVFYRIGVRAFSQVRACLLPAAPLFNPRRRDLRHFWGLVE